MPTINQTLNNRYKVLARIGKGAMGEVYRGLDRQTNQTVALKVITRELALDPEMLERFRREGEALRQLRHANIVAFVDMFAYQSQQVIVMEYMPGGSLYALIRQGALPPARAREIALDLCDALIRAHRLNIIHRDIKPENVLLADDGTPKITDFGVARLVAAGTRLTGTGMQVGTPYYMSPEAWEGKALDAQADVWSLGVVLFEMLTGHVPFDGDTVVAVMNQVLNAPLPNVLALRPDTPPAMVRVIDRALARDKSQRYPTVRQMSAELELCAPAASAPALVKELPASTPKVEAPKRGSPVATDRPSTQAIPAKQFPFRLRPALALGAVLGVLMVGGVLAAGGLGLWRFNAAQNTNRATQTAAAVGALLGAIQSSTDTPIPATSTLPPSDRPAQPTLPPPPSDTPVPPTLPASSTPPAQSTATPVPVSPTAPRLSASPAAPTSADTGGTIMGLVRWNTAGFEGVRVKVCTQWLFSCQTREYSATSNAQGNYRLDNLPPGDYYIITKMMDQQDETRWSPNGPKVPVITVTAGKITHQDVDVLKHDLRLSSPSYGTTISDTRPVLSWKAYPGATRYQVSAGRSPGNGNFISYELTTTTQMAVTNPIGSGEKCYWRVQAFNDQAELAISSDYWFVVGP